MFPQALPERSSEVSSPPVRVWLVSKDESWMVQLQRDRFYANWRRRGETKYPGFSRTGGAMEFAVAEFARLQEFCTTRRSTTPKAVAVEISKIDVLIQGKHWKDADDSIAMMPMLGPWAHALKSPKTAIALKWQEEIAETTLAVSLVIMPGCVRPERYKLEFRGTKPLRNDVSTELKSLSKTLNQAFERVIPEYETRFS